MGFGDEIEDVRRDVFRQRVADGGRPDYIPINFFLFNKTVRGVDYVVADELVFQALTAKHSPRFDKLALFAFNFSYAGRWARARQEQRRPAIWAYHYIRDRVAAEFKWDISQVNADDIEAFVSSDPRYRAQGARKLATNLNYLYEIGRLRDLASGRVDRWWVDALFLALDRLIEDRSLEGARPSEGQFASLLSQSGFADIAGRRSLEKDLATRHLIHLYRECGARDRFSQEYVKERTELKLPDLQWYIANDTRPQGAVHPTNPNILKSIPRACAMLATYAGFEVIDAEELESFDAEDFIRRHTQLALEKLRDQQVQPTLTAEELMKITRDR
ncbi:MAG TPA: hypothetical protein VL358_09940 [Caulobacteraceae bacterium]|nr:hypothetical protein [Caulobacteraceae bacterium]